MVVYFKEKLAQHKKETIKISKNTHKCAFSFLKS